MRLGLVVLLVACNAYDPVAEIDHREYPDARSAVSAILANVPSARVYAVGEYHMTRAAGAGFPSPMSRFTGEIIDLLAPHAQHLVVEAWLDDGCRADELGTKVAATTGRAHETASELDALVHASRERQLDAHGLAMTCIEQGAMLDGHGRVDFIRLLELITEKLHDAAEAYSDKGVIVYGGALHNDLYPHWQLDDFSYARALKDKLHGGVLEIDLVVPEAVAPMPFVRQEPWFPLLARAAPGRAIVWEREPDSYVVILPAASTAVAKIAAVD